jgi:hypothetical protein
MPALEPPVRQRPHYVGALSPKFQHVNNITNFPKPLGDSSRHCRRGPLLAVTFQANGQSQASFRMMC